MEIKGKLLEKETSVINGKNGVLNKIVFLIQIPGNKPKNLQLESVSKEVVSILEDTNIGKEISVEFSVESRDWTGSNGVKKWFTSATAWKVSLDKDVKSEKPIEHTSAAEIQNASVADADDLPF